MPDTVIDTAVDTAGPSETPLATGDRHETGSTGSGEGLTIGAAAARLGMHPNTLRKRIRKGTLRAFLVDGPTGREYRIPAAALEALGAPTASQTRPSPPASTVSSTGFTTVDPAVPTTVDPTESGTRRPESDSSGTGAAMQPLARAREMAAYTEELLAPWRRRVEAQAEEIGRLKAELDHAREAPAERTAAPAATAAAAPARPRPWWRFW